MRVGHLPPKVELEVTLTLTESEARALEALAAYGADQFLKAFYSQLGKAYLEPHEAGLRTLFEGIGKLAPILARADKARDAFRERPAPAQGER